MKYILDFDGVILNTEALKKKMAEFGIEESKREASVFETMRGMDPSIKVSDFLFPDAEKFLRNNGASCVIVSSYLSVDPENNNEDYETQRLFQKTKIKQAGVFDIVGEDNVHVVGESKAGALSELKSECDKNGEECIFIDDRKVYIEEAIELGVPAFWMNRKQKSLPHEKVIESTNPAEVMSFTELETRLSSWDQ